MNYHSRQQASLPQRSLSERCGAQVIAHRRRGAAAVEGAIVLGTCAVLLLGIFDLGLAVLRSNLLTSAASRLGREVATHGSLAPPKQTTWGPATLTDSAAGSSEAAAAVSNLLPTLDPAAVQLKLTWLDGDTTAGNRVQVQLSYTHQAIVPWSIYGTSLPLIASCLVRIEH